MSKITRGIVALVALCGLSLLLLNCGSTVNRSTGLLYVLVQGTDQVSSYSINLNSGSLSLINSNASTCASTTTGCGQPLDIILDPTNANAFVLNRGDVNPATPGGTPVPPSIYGYKVNSDGSLAAGTDLTTSAGVFTPCDLATAMARDASGNFLFVITEGNQSVTASCPVFLFPQLYVFSISNGGLSLVSDTSLTFVPSAVAVNAYSSTANPSTTLTLYVTGKQDLSGNINHFDSTLNQWAVDSSGNLTPETDPVTGLAYATAGKPSAVLSFTTNPVGGAGGTFVYVANSTNGNINVLQLCVVENANCATADVTHFRLLPVGTGISSGSNPVAMVLDPTKSFLYSVANNSSQVFGYRVNGSQGTLTALSPASLSTGGGPVGIAMHSTGKFLFVSNNGASDISSFGLNTTSGSMTAVQTITSLANPAGLVSR